MLIQLIKESFLILFWRELTPKKNSRIKLGLKEKTRPGFDAALVSATWGLAIFLLLVSVPHSYEVIHRYERGDESFRDVKSVLLAVTIEVIAALVLLIALHSKKLEGWQRRTMFSMAAPFVVLTLHLQFVYYAGLEQWLIYPWELAAVLPGGVLVCAVVVAFLWAARHQEQPAAVVVAPEPQQLQFDFGAFADKLRAELRASFEEQVIALNRKIETVAAEIGERLAEAQPPQSAVETAILRAEIADLRKLVETTAAQSAVRSPQQSAEVRPQLRVVEPQQQPPQADPQNYAEALRLYQELGSFAAVGRALGKSENTAKTWVKKAQELAEQLAGD
jgi:hypothetical protein